ncbi:MAG: hypothetical protein ACYS8L_03195 [Planctomycetota bacterium]|jgi:hypothetical protein
MFRSLLRIGKWILLGIVAITCIAFVLGLVVMALWNWIMPEVFGLPRITYWQAWGLLLLGHILFGAARAEHRTEHRHGDGFRETVKQQLASPPDEGDRAAQPGPAASS